jgi:hypothetical protein
MLKPLRFWKKGKKLSDTWYVYSTKDDAKTSNPLNFKSIHNSISGWGNPITNTIKSGWNQSNQNSPSQTWDFSHKSNEQIPWKKKKVNLLETYWNTKKRGKINQKILENLHRIINRKSQTKQKGKSKPTK